VRLLDKVEMVVRENRKHIRGLYWRIRDAKRFDDEDLLK
jgi:hypothetical protein